MTSTSTDRGGAAPLVGAAPPRGRSTLQRQRARAGLVAVSPALVLIVVFFVAPLFLMVWMSFHNWPLLGSVQRFIGLQNYQEVATDQTFIDSVLFTLKYTAIVTPIQLVLGYALAITVRQKLRGQGLFRTFYFLPVVVGFASGAYVFLVLVQPDSGVFDQVLEGLGITHGPTPWLTDPNLALLTVILMITWKTIGTSIILLMVGMQSIPEEIGEAARVDGAQWWQREWFVILPLMKPTIALVLMLTITGSFLAFDQFFVLTHGGPNASTLTIVMWIYTTAFVRYRLGYSAALSIVLLVLLVVFSIIQIRALRERSEASS